MFLLINLLGHDIPPETFESKIFTQYVKFTTSHDLINIYQHIFLKTAILNNKKNSSPNSGYTNMVLTSACLSIG